MLDSGSDGAGRMAHEMPFGAQILPDGRTRFRLWAPSVVRAELQLFEDAASPERKGESFHGMRVSQQGWHEIIVSGAGPGSRYKFLVYTKDGDSRAVPDPASRRNPDGVHAASVVVDPWAYAWRDPSWRGRAWTDAVIYEIHIGTFTQAGTFAAAAGRLPDVAALGITALQIMPLAAFAGARNWGYDGVLPFAPAACYGSPDELKAFIDAAHGLGLMVFLDVVYNHFGPEGNYLHSYCPEFFNPAHRTPWGAAINFDGEMSRTVRDFFVHNALYWVEEYCFDGLRLDAVHAIRDASTPDIVCEIARALRDGPGRRRLVHLALENNRNEARYLMRDARGQPVYATAQWDDDVHHALHVLTSGETDGYYSDYAAAPLACLGRSLAQGFAYQGEHSSFRGKSRGEASAHLPPDAFVGFLQNHDMIGNRAFGGRIHTFADARLLRAAYACLLLSPQVPMLFMGEEFDASAPFLFFCDYGPELAQAVRQGRQREFRRFAAFADEAALSRIPDPNSAATFAASKLRWEERERSPHRERAALVRELLALRRLHLTPRLARISRGGRFKVDGSLLRLEWDIGSDSRWCLLAHFGLEELITEAAPAGEVVFAAGVRRDPTQALRLEAGAALVTCASGITHSPA
jgi:maltooligosyltrehalose trehalohydrolase